MSSLRGGCSPKENVRISLWPANVYAWDEASRKQRRWWGESGREPGQCGWRGLQTWPWPESWKPVLHCLYQVYNIPVFCAWPLIKAQNFVRHHVNLSFIWLFSLFCCPDLRVIIVIRYIFLKINISTLTLLRYKRHISTFCSFHHNTATRNQAHWALP